MRQISLFKLVLFLGVFVLIVACSQVQQDTLQTPTPIGTISAGSDTADTVYVGVLAIRSAVAASAQYQPILSYLSEEIGRPFKLVALSQDTQYSEVEQGNLHFTFNNPLAAVQLRRLYGTKFLATLARVHTGPEFGGLIVTRPGSGIVTLDDLRSKRATCVDFQTAAAGCIFQIFHLLENGIDPYLDFASFIETPSQDNIILGVLNDTFDVGFVRTGQLEKMVTEGTLISVAELVIIDQSEDDFFYPHTTHLYPEWPMAALAETDPPLVNAVADALLALSADHPAMINAGAVGFVAPVDYSPIDELIETLQLPSWDAPNP